MGVIYKKINKKIAKSGSFDLFIKTLTGATTVLKACSDMTIYEVKALLEKDIGVVVNQNRLIFAGKQLEDGTLASYNIGTEATLHMILRLRGGMYQETSGKDGNYEELKCNIFEIEPDLSGE